MILSESRTTYWNTGEPGSLLAMLEIKARAFALAVDYIAQLSQAQFIAGDPGDTEPASEHLAPIGAIRYSLEALGLNSSIVSLGRVETILFNTPPPIRYSDLMKRIDEFRGRFYDELGEQLFLVIPLDRTKFYNLDAPLNSAAMAAFPSSSRELRAAGNAYAADLPTACVFHCMRALEYGLLALAADLGIPQGTETWHVIIDQIEYKIANQRNAPRGVSRNARLQFLSEAANEFRYFKDGWRNYVSHGNNDYDDTKALRVMEHVKSFIEVLSSELKE